jgi:hypothetical protein
MTKPKLKTPARRRVPPPRKAAGDAESFEHYRLGHVQVEIDTYSCAFRLSLHSHNYDAALECVEGLEKALRVARQALNNLKK